MGLIISIIVFLCLFLNQGKAALAVNNLDWAKNKFGIHVTSNVDDLKLADSLLNTNGGDWGWITVVIREDELSKQHWQNFFNHCRRLHLIPIVRLSTYPKESVWIKPGKNSIRIMADFLNQLNWPIKNQFIIIYNEPNRGDEWGGIADPKGYFDLLEFSADYFHSLNENFFILSGGLDLAAPYQPGKYYSPEEFYRQGYIVNQEVFEKIDGLASHSYPNHGYMGAATDQGKTSIKGWQWELDYLKTLGVKKTLPVFITETGWPHQEGKIENNRFYPAEKTAQFISQAYQIWEKEDQVIAVTPFILSHQSGTFTNFSWLDQDQKPYSQYQAVSKIEKRSQKPPQIEEITVRKINLPLTDNSDEVYWGEITLENTGQSIWGEKEKFCFNPFEENQGVGYLSSLCLKQGQTKEPESRSTFRFEITFKRRAGLIQFGWEKTAQFRIKKLPLLFPAREIRAKDQGPNLPLEGETLPAGDRFRLRVPLF